MDTAPSDVDPATVPAPLDPPGSDALDRTVLRVAAVVILAVLMAFLDSTVVNVALQSLALGFRTSLDTIQWVATAYLLALAAITPVTGWASDRFGTKRVFLLAIVLFLAGSMLTGAAWDVQSLIFFRVVQGIGAGLLTPAGMTILTRAAGPQRVGRVMAVLGIPLLLGPICGPILGGWLVDVASWRWIFYINAPIGIVALALAVVVLPRDVPEPAQRLDVPGLLLLSPGLALLIFGVSKIPSAGGFGATVVWLPVGLGVALIAAFVRRSARVTHPLIDLSLFRNRMFAWSMATLALFSVAFLGAMLLVPTYLILVRGESALMAGLWMAPQGIGAMLTMRPAGRLVDQGGTRKVVLPGLLAIAAGLGVFTWVGPDTSYAVLLPALFVSGLGLGATMMPVMTGALQTLAPQQIARASSATTIVQQTFAAIGSAVLSVVLAALLAARFGVPVGQGQLAATKAMADPVSRAANAVPVAHAFGTAFTVAVVLILLGIIPALLLPRPRAA